MRRDTKTMNEKDAIEYCVQKYQEKLEQEIKKRVDT
jgi:hypothetical protein